MKWMLIGTLLAMSSGAHAYSEQQAKLCTPDAFRLCGSDIPDIEKVTACMRKQKAQLSSGCRAVFDQPASAQTPAAQTISAR